MIRYGSVDKKVTDTSITFAPRERCVRIKLSIDSTITIERGVGVSSIGVVIGGRRRTRTRTRRTRKEREKDPVRHDKKTDRYGRTNASGDHEYLFRDNNQSQ